MIDAFGPSQDGPWGGLLRGTTSTLWLAVASGVPALVAAWLLFAPGLMLSREMTWDLLFNLSGAWHLAHGHVPHVDFHTPFGVLGFALTAIGFAVAGPTPAAFLVGQLIVLAFGLLTAVPAAARRLAPLPAVVFVVYAALLILMPANLGDDPWAYSFAMSYNRWGWAALMTLGLLLFIAPRRDERRPWFDVATSALLIAFLFYLKLTFAVAALAAVVAAVVAVAHVRRHWQWWTALTVGAGAWMVAPWHHPYLQDAWTSGHERTDLTAHVNTLLAGRFEYTQYLAVILVLVWLWQRGWATIEAAIAATLLLGLGVLVLSQNAQAGDIPLGVVIMFVLYNRLGPLHRMAPQLPRSSLTTLLVLVLLPPGLAVATATKVVAGYYRAATNRHTLTTPTTTNLSGLAVPAPDFAVTEALAATGHQLLSSARIPPLRDAVTQAEYVSTLLEAAAHLAGAPAKVLLLDQVNALPFVLGYPPPRGGPLWLWPEATPPPADQIFGDVDVVLIPKYSTYAPATAYALTTYNAYLTRAFPARAETAGWTVLRRASRTEREGPHAGPPARPRAAPRPASAQGTTTTASPEDAPTPQAFTAATRTK